LLIEKIFEEKLKNSNFKLKKDMSSGRDRKRKDNSSFSSNPSPSKSPRVTVETAAHEPFQNEETLSIHDANRKSISPLSRFPTPASQVVNENQKFFSSVSLYKVV